jgi:hypothetical protein
MTLDQCIHCKHNSVDSYTWGESLGFYRISFACDITQVSYTAQTWPPAVVWRAPDVNCEKFETE